MENTLLLINAKITKEDDSEFKLDDLDKVLKENGFTYEGKTDILQKVDVEKDMKEIKESMSDEVMEVMIRRVMNFYDETSPLDVFDFFANYAGSFLHTSVFKDYLPKETKEKFTDLTEKWWTITHELCAELGCMVCNYIKRTYADNNN